jgi:choline monooxygenase
VTTPPYGFEPRIAHAETIPARWYSDPAVYDSELDRVFGRTWQLVGRAGQLATVGSYLTATIGREPVLVVRSDERTLRAFSNVCRHRAGPVATGEGTVRTLRCGYHGWTYALDGRLLNTPEFDGVERFAREAVCLPEFRVETWAGLVFVNTDPSAEPLLSFLDDLPDRLGGRDLSGFQPAARKDWHVECNWKVYVDNYLEGYHIPIVHPGLNREIDYARYWTEVRRNYSIQHSPLKRAGEGRIRVDADAPDSDVTYVWIYPNLMLNVYPDNYSTNLIVPLGPDRTLTAFEWFVRDSGSAETMEAVREAVAFSDEVQLEDISICEAVQRNLSSRTYLAGRYSPKRENGVHHFHGLLAKFLSD